MPDSSSCGVGNTSASICELMGNSSYRGLLLTRSSVGANGINVGLQVNCINPSNTVGAQLQLQYANYSDTSHTNSTNFVNIGSQVFIDNSANWPCQGVLEATTGLLASINANPAAYEFRVVGIGGGGTGDNPRFSSVSIYIIQNIQRAFIFRNSAISITAFTEVVAITPQALVSASTVVVFDWIATNNFVAGQSGTATCTIAIGTGTCSVTTTFAVPFVTTAPNVVVDSRSSMAVTSFPTGTINLLSAQTLTV